MVIAYCGIVCSECPTFIATTEDDDEKRKETAKLWSKQFNASVKPEDINCEGCLSHTEVLVNTCKVCKIRKCGMDRGIINCAYCYEYACDRLNEFFKSVPRAKITLDSIRKTL